MSLHELTVSLKPNVTSDQFKTFYLSKVIPAFEKAFEAKGYLVKGVRGEHANSLGIYWLFEKESTRDKYFSDDGNPTELGKAAIDKLDPINKELDKFATVDTKYTDWVVK